MFCNNCGKEIAPNIAFCNNCGAPVAKVAQPQNSNVQQSINQNVQTNIQQNTSQTVQTNVQAYTNTGSGVTEEEFLKKLKGTKMFCILVSVINGFSLLASLITFHLFTAMITAATIALFICFYIFTKQRKIAGPILGFVVSGLYFFNALIYFLATGVSAMTGEGAASNAVSAIISIVLGIAVLNDCLVMYKFLKNNNKV